MTSILTTETGRHRENAEAFRVSGFKFPVASSRPLSGLARNLKLETRNSFFCVLRALRIKSFWFSGSPAFIKNAEEIHAAGNAAEVI
jgi:hypothetical protein